MPEYIVPRDFLINSKPCWSPSPALRGSPSTRGAMTIVLQQCQPEEDEARASQASFSFERPERASIDYERIDQLKRERRSARDLRLQGETSPLAEKRQEHMRKIERSLIKDRLT